MSVVSCRACGAPIDQDLDAPDGTRAPCSQCGAAVRTFDVHQTEAVLLSDYRKRHIKRRGAKGRPSKEEHLVGHISGGKRERVFADIAERFRRLNEDRNSAIGDPQSRASECRVRGPNSPLLRGGLD
jgi:hypothetical protein